MSFKNVSIKPDSNKDELDKVLTKEAIEHLKVRFPRKIDEIFQISDAKLSELSKEVEAKNHKGVEAIIRRELIEDDIDLKEEGETLEEKTPTLDTITLGTTSMVIEKLKFKLADEINKRLNPFHLEDYQELNILTGITGKIINSGVLDSFLNGTNKFISKILEGKFNEAFKVGDNAGKFETIINDNMGDLVLLLEENKKKKIPNINKLLSNPLSIGDFKTGDKLESIEKLSEEKLTTYLLGLNEKILNYDSKIGDIIGMKEGVVGILSKAPPLVQEGIQKLLGLLLKIPILGDIIAGLLGHNDTKKALDGFGEELKHAKATNNLIRFGGEFDNLGIKTSDSINDNKIEILKDKNLQDLSYKKLTPFYKMCKGEGIGYTNEAFWVGLFNGVTPQEGNEKMVALHKKLKINDNDFDNNKPKDSFYKKLNELKLKEPIEKLKEDHDIGKLGEEKRALESKIIKEEDFNELDTEDLEDLKNITLEYLISDGDMEFVWQIGPVDYNSVKGLINKLRDRVLEIQNKQGKNFKKHIEEVTGKKYEKITIGLLLSKLYINDNKRIKEIDAILDRNKQIKAIKDGLNKQLLDGELLSFNYEFKGNTETVSFDLGKQEITIGGEVFKIKLNSQSASVSNIEKTGDKIILTPSMVGIDMSGKKVTLSIDEFSAHIVTLINKGKIKLGDGAGSIEKVV